MEKLISPRRGYRINDPSVIFQSFDDEIVVIHLASGTYHSLQGIAGEAFLGLGIGGATRYEVAQALAHVYDAPVERIEQDLGPYFAKLEGELLIVPVEVEPRSVQAPPAGQRRAVYCAPDFDTHRDLQQLFLIDPVHDVGAAGWPNLAGSPVADAAGKAAANLVVRYAGAHVIYEKMSDETIAMNTWSGGYHSLSGTAEDVFLLIQQSPSVEELLAALAAKYTEMPADLEAAVREYLAALAAAGLIAMEPVELGREVRQLGIDRPGSGHAFSPMRIESFQDAPAVPDPLAQAAVSPARGRFRIRTGDLLVASAGGELVVVDRELGDYYRLNAAAADVLELLRGQALNTQEVTAALLGKYEASERNLTCAVLILLRNLAQMKLIAFEAGGADDPAVTPAFPSAGAKLPFPGFLCEVHKDLRSALSPINVGDARSQAKYRAANAVWYLDALRDYFEEAAARAGSAPERLLTAGGGGVRLRFAGDTYVADLTKALSHLETASGLAELTIHVWDAATPFSDPYFAEVLDKLFLDWSAHCGARGQVSGIHGDRATAIYHPGPDILSVVDGERGEAYFLKRDRTPAGEVGSPFRYIFHSWFASRGLQFVHGAAVGTADGGVLVAGKRESGKSTTARLCAEAGMLIAGDDYCLVDPATGILSSLYSTGTLSGSICPGFPLRAMVIPSVGEQATTRIEPCSPAEVLLALMPGTVAKLPAANPGDGERLARLAGSLPAFHLRLGSDLSQIPGVVRSALA